MPEVPIPDARPMRGVPGPKNGDPGPRGVPAAPPAVPPPTPAPRGVPGADPGAARGVLAAPLPPSREVGVPLLGVTGVAEMWLATREEIWVGAELGPPPDFSFSAARAAVEVR
jgi:hypothetical protein